MREPRPPAPTYRIYHFGSDGRIVRAEVVFAADDAQASAVARARRDRGPIELWERGRQVAIDPPRDGGPHEPTGHGGP